MSKLYRFLVLGAALLAGFQLMGHAQMLTANTITTGTNAPLQSIVNGSVMDVDVGYTQTFSNITSIDTLTLRFASTTSGLATPVDLQLVFAEWSGSDAMNLLGSGTISLAPPATWMTSAGYFFFDATIDFSSIANSLSVSKTYGLTVVGTNTTHSNGVFIGGENGSAPYVDGSVFTHNGVSDYNDLTSGGAAFAAVSDFAFLGSSVTADYDPFAVTPVPEASTIAVLFAGLFVGGMAYKRLRDRRKVSETVEG